MAQESFVEPCRSRTRRRSVALPRARAERTTATQAVLFSLCAAGCSSVLGDPFDVTAASRRADPELRADVDSGSRDAEIESGADRPNLTVALERSPVFEPFENAQFYSRTDPRTGEAVRATVRVKRANGFDLERAPELAVEAEGAALAFAFDEAVSDERTAVFSRMFEPGDPAGSYGLRLSWSEPGEARTTTELEPKLELRDAPEPGRFGAVDLSVDERLGPQTFLSSRRWGIQTAAGHRYAGDSLQGVVRQASLSPEHCIAQVLVHEGLIEDAVARPGALLGVVDLQGVSADGCSERRARFSLRFEGPVEIGLFVTPVTASGHAGAAQRVAHGEWVATLEPGATGGTPEAPHALKALAHWPRTPHDETARSIPLAARGEALPYQATWEPKPAPSGSPSLWFAAAAYDPTRGRVHVVDSSEPTWVWDGSIWTRQADQARAPENIDAAAYDAARDRLVVITDIVIANSDDMAGTQVVDAELYEWAAGHWQLQEPAHRPQSDLKHLVYDPSRKQTIATSDCDDETWAWDGVDWRALGAIPNSEVCIQALVYDSTRKRVRALGRDSERTRLYELGDEGWSELGSEDPPPALEPLLAAYDARQERIVVLGRTWDAASSVERHQTWVWSDEAWTRFEDGEVPSDAQLLVYDSVRGNVDAFSGSWELTEHSRLGTGGWETVTRSPMPPARSLHGMVYDAARGALLVAGGESEYASFSDTWENAGRGWIRRAAQLSPHLSVGSTRVTLAYDAGRGVTVSLHPAVGEDDRGLEAGGTETIVYDGSTWKELPIDPAMPARVDSAATYDAARSRVVAFGGRAEHNYSVLNDTWQWDGSSWAAASSEVSPPGRTLHALAYDASRERVFLFGGAGESETGPTYLADSWEWDGTVWRELAPAGPGPRGRARHALAYDARRRRIVLFGGAPAEDAVLGDTWEWDGASWQLAQPIRSPPARAGHAMAYDPVRERVVLFGGDNNGQFSVPNAVFADQWEWDGTSWVDRTSYEAPLHGHSRALAYDSRRERVVMFGGADDPQNASRPLDDLWEWDGSRWRQRFPTLSPSLRRSPLVFDDIGAKVIMLGGAEDAARYETWGWDGTDWARLATEGPALQAPYSMFFDVMEPRAVLLGRDQAWQWRDDAWSSIATSMFPDPDPWVAASTYDSDAGRVILYDGSGSKLWSWRDASWNALESSAQIQCLVYDGVTRSTFAVLDDFGDQLDNDVVMLKDDVIRPVATRDAPEEVCTCSGVYDASREQTLMLVGANCFPSESRYVQTWLLSTTQPAHEVEIALEPLLHGPAGSHVELDAFAFHAVSGADVQVDDETVRGAALDVWDGQQFTQVLAHEADSDAPASLCFESSEQAALNELEVAGKWHFVLRPLEKRRSSELPRISTTAFEARVRYHLREGPAALRVGGRSGACDAAGWAYREWRSKS